ncbi:MAG TPA: methyltransferase domain-containing protein, partial [Kofleriaceae bacterium]|nr:methyltransferase domain-containing protein [Kofleriaceae bacterium]
MTTDAFSGSVPENYDRYLGPVLFEPYARELVARIPRRDGLRVLEIACGTGIVTRHLRDALPPSATLTATDLSDAMVGYAARAIAAAGIVWQPADAQSLPFGDGAFDLAVCQFGLMFLPDKVRGFAEARRVLAPGGQLIATVWQSLDANPFAAAMARTLADLFPADPPRILDVIHGYGDPERIAADMRAAGWDDIAFEPVAINGHGRAAADLAIGFACGSP